jgi:hypothetical protein
MLSLITLLKNWESIFNPVSNLQHTQNRIVFIMDPFSRLERPGYVVHIRETITTFTIFVGKNCWRLREIGSSQFVHS